MSKLEDFKKQLAKLRKLSKDERTKFINDYMKEDKARYEKSTEGRVYCRDCKHYDYDEKNVYVPGMDSEGGRDCQHRCCFRIIPDFTGEFEGKARIFDKHKMNRLGDCEFWEEKETR